MHVTAVELERFKGFNCSPPRKIPLAPWLTAIIGPNRTGKTSILQSLAIAGWTCKENRTVDNRIDSGSNGWINTPFDYILSGNFLGSAPIEARERNCSFKTTFSDASELSIKFRQNKLLVEAPRLEKTPSLRVTYVPRDMHFPGTPEEKRLSEEKLAEVGVVASGSHTANYVAFLQQAMRLGELDTIMGQVFPGIGTLEVATLKKAYRLRFRRGDRLYPWYQEGSGVAFVLTIFAAVFYDIAKRFASIGDVAAGIREVPYEYIHLVALDEPTSSLHPQAFPALIHALESLDIQVVIATHSVDFLLAGSTLSSPDIHLVNLTDDE